MTSSSSTIELFIASYSGEDGAGTSLKDFQAAQRAGAIELIDAAVIVHTADGKVKFEETADPSGKKWAKRGAIAGGVVRTTHRRPSNVSRLVLQSRPSSSAGRFRSMNAPP